MLFRSKKPLRDSSLTLCENLREITSAKLCVNFPLIGKNQKGNTRTASFFMLSRKNFHYMALYDIFSMILTQSFHIENVTVSGVLILNSGNPALKSFRKIVDILRSISDHVIAKICDIRGQTGQLPKVAFVLHQLLHNY